jgi:hypothetical protein
MKDAIEVSMVFHEGNRMMAVPKQPAPVQEPVAALIDENQRLRAELKFNTLPAQPAPVQPVAWTERELELIDGMIEVQLDHAKRCDSIANRTMADKQKGWDLERVALLQKIKATPPAAQPAPEQYTALEQALTRLQKRYAELEAKAAAQPAVPDAITDDSESPEYRTGWNDCRQAMMEMMK